MSGEMVFFCCPFTHWFHNQWLRVVSYRFWPQQPFHFTNSFLLYSLINKKRVKQSSSLQSIEESKEEMKWSNVELRNGVVFRGRAPAAITHKMNKLNYLLLSLFVGPPCRQKREERREWSWRREEDGAIQKEIKFLFVGAGPPNQYIHQSSIQWRWIELMKWMLVCLDFMRLVLFL